LEPAAGYGHGGNFVWGAGGATTRFSQPSGLTANISAKALTETGLSASNKIYDATTAANSDWGGGAASERSGRQWHNCGWQAVRRRYGEYHGTPTGTFASKDVANGISVTVSGTSLTGAQSGNYTLTQQTGLTANITPKALTVSGLSASGKIYDATTAATLTGTQHCRAQKRQAQGQPATGKPYTVTR